MRKKVSFGKRKSTQGVIVGAIVIAIILAGTFAWISFTQSALNIFEGWTNPDVNLHDDFDPNTGNKDVYVENSGQRPLYVRVKFDEYMDIDGNNILGGANLRGKVEDWFTHAYIGTGNADYCGEEFHDYYQWIMGKAPGDPNNGWKYFLPAPFENRALFDENGIQLRNPIAVEFKDDQEFYGYSNGSGGYEWGTLKEAYERIDGILADNITDPAITLSWVGGGLAQFAGTTNLDYLNWLYTVVERDIPATPAGDRTNALADRAAAQAEIDRFLKDNELGFWNITYDVAHDQGLSAMDLDKDTIAKMVTDGNLINEKTVFVPLKRTAATQVVYTMSQWITQGMPVGNFWVMDTDGWCYWADVLLPGQTTGLLLSEVVLDKLNPPNGVWYYGINVTLQAATADDVYRFGLIPLDTDTTNGAGGGFTEQGETLLNAVSGKYVYGVNPADVAGGSIDLSKPILTYRKFNDNTYRLVTMNGDAETYGPLFIHTKPTGSNLTSMTDLYGTFSPGTPYGDWNDNSQYKIGTEFWKVTEIVPAEKWVKFTIVDAGFGSGVLEAKNGKRYVKLQYETTKTAWLAVGPNGVFDALVANNASGSNIIPVTFGAGATDLVSNNDDLLIWTDAVEPGTDDRYQEDPPAKSLKVGDTIRGIDGQDWLVLGKDADTEKTLIITVETEGSAVADAGAAISTYNGSISSTLTDLHGADSGITAILLTAQDAIDYFANNAARAANQRWWLAGGAIIDTTGAFTNVDGSVFIRPAIWIDSQALYELVYPATP